MNFIDTLTDEKITLDGKEYSLLRLGDFFKLELLRKKLKDDIQKKDKNAFKETIENIIFLQTRNMFKKESFFDRLQAAYMITIRNRIGVDAAIFRPRTNTKEVEKVNWDYDGRTLAVWIDTFAQNYHWSLSEILNLPLNMAIYLYQEITVNAQLKREWEYSLTDLAYPYNKTLDKNEYKPLQRPDWMMAQSGNTLVPVTKIPKSMLPFGVVTDLSGMGVLSNNEQSFNLSKEQTKEQKDGS
jgi:hypothetical protein